MREQIRSIAVERCFISLPREETEERSCKLRTLLLRGALRCADGALGNHDDDPSNWDNKSQ